MNFAPYQWRAGKGYLPPPGSTPAPVFPMYYYPNHPMAYPGPYVAIPPPAPSVASTPAPSPPKKEAKKVDKTISCLPSIAPGESSTGKSVIHCTNEMKPPSIRPGTNYMYPKEHTMLHVFSKAAPVWEGKYKGQGLQFKIFKVFTGMTVKNVIERVMKKDGEGCKGWVVTEVYERGEGEWTKGTTIAYDSDKAKGTLGSMGWGAKRGDSLPPVWLTVHKA